MCSIPLCKIPELSSLSTASDPILSVFYECNVYPPDRYDRFLQRSQQTRMQYDVCNKKVDCTLGEDEWGIDCGKMTIVGGFRCPRDKKIVHPFKRTSSLTTNCMYSYDDKVAEKTRYNDRFLPAPCQSKGLAMVCSNITFITKIKHIRYQVVTNS